MTKQAKSMGRLNSWTFLFAFLSFSFLHLDAFAVPNHVILGYSPQWSDEAFPPEGYNYDALTHIARAFLEPDADGHIPVPKGYFNPALTKEAKAHGVKLIASLGGASMGSENWVSLSSHPAYLKRFLDELGLLITGNGWDGVDIDWENAPQTGAEQRAYTTLMTSLRARFPKWILTTALMVGDQWFRHTSWTELSGSVDYLGLMTYDFCGEWSEYAFHNANLYSVPGSKAEDGISADEVVGRLRDRYGVSPEKALLGVPFYGRLFFVKRWNDRLPKEDPKAAGLRYADVLSLAQSGGFTEKWDEIAQAPYLQGEGETGMGTYDNPRSLALKCRYVLDHKLSGVLIWSLGSDLVGNQTPLLDALALSFGGKAQPVPLKALTQVDWALKVSAKSAFDDLTTLSQTLVQSGKGLEAQSLAPEPLRDLKSPAPRNSSKLVAQVSSLQAYLTRAGRKFSKARKILKALSPHMDSTDSPLPMGGDRFLVDDFKKKGVNRLGLPWTAAVYPPDPQTELNPVPYILSKCGCPDTQGFAGKLRGRYAQSLPPWSRAELGCFLAREGKPLNLSGFNALRFWAKGDGGTYNVALGREGVKDGAQFQGTFLASPEWRRITLPLSAFHQPRWGRPMSPKWTDIQRISFSPVHGINGSDFDLTVDEIEFVKLKDAKKPINRNKR